MNRGWGVTHFLIWDQDWEQNEGTESMLVKFPKGLDTDLEV